LQALSAQLANAEIAREEQAKEQAKSPLQATVVDVSDEPEVGQQSTSDEQQEPVIIETPVEKPKAKKPKKEKTLKKEKKLNGKQPEEKKKKKQKTSPKVDYSSRILELLSQIEVCEKWWQDTYAKDAITCAFITIAKVLCSEGTCKIVSAEGEVENNISIVELVEQFSRSGKLSSTP
jgi:hypothetical protein